MNVKGAAVAKGAAGAARFPKTGLNVVLAAADGAVEAGAGPADTAPAVELPLAELVPLSLFGGAPKIGLNRGAADAAAGPGWLAGGALSAPKRTLGFGGEGGLLGVWPSSQDAGVGRLLAPPRG